MKNRQVEVLPNGIDLSLFFQPDPEEKVKIKKQLGLQEKSMVIGHIGRFHEQKNHVFYGTGTDLKEAGGLISACPCRGWTAEAGG